MSVTINPDRAAERADGIYINEARELGLNGAKFTFTSKADSSVVYSGIVKNGRLAVADLVNGDYSVTAELIPGTTTEGGDFTIKTAHTHDMKPIKCSVMRRKYVQLPRSVSANTTRLQCPKKTVRITIRA